MVNAVFADACYFLALSLRRDRLHQQALALAAVNRRLLTTDWVLAEVAAALAAPLTRSRFTALMSGLKARDDVTIVPARNRHFKMGCALYAQRKDKGWSLTDCISFLVMWRYGLTSALTSDKHFSQAGFQILMSTELCGVAEPTPAYGAAVARGEGHRKQRAGCLGHPELADRTNPSVARMSSWRLPRSKAEWPASGTMRRSASGHARCRSQALFMGQTMS